MPSGFKLETKVLSMEINSHGHNQNCYYCTVAALSGKTTDKLVKMTSTMQQDQANPTEIAELFRAAGESVDVKGPLTDPKGVLNWVEGYVDEEEAVGLAYVRADLSGHMVVMRNTTGSKKCIDFQRPCGLREMEFPPEPNILQYYVFMHM